MTAARVWGGLSCTRWAVGFDGRDDDLLELLKGISQVPPFQNILTGKVNKRVLGQQILLVDAVKNLPNH